MKYVIQYSQKNGEEAAGKMKTYDCIGSLILSTIDMIRNLNGLGEEKITISLTSD